jgi:hypothetical protein
MRGRQFIFDGALRCFLAILLGAVFELGGAWPGVRMAGAAACWQLRDPSELERYANIRSIVDWTLDELTRALPELKRLEPAEGRQELPLILQRVGENVEVFFRNFPNTSSLEQVTQRRWSGDGWSEKEISQRFHYLALTRPAETGPGLDEYRTDAQGKQAELHGLQRGFLLTQGFVSMAIYFHPLEQPGSAFRYLGQQMMQKRQTYVVAFAQRPVTARVTGQTTIGENSVAVFVQGVAWIDPASFQIVRLRTDLLAPREDIGLKRQTTEVDFDEVRFSSVAARLWLPRKVAVRQEWKDWTFYNLHRYSDFKLFKVEATSGPAQPNQKP